MEYEEGIKNISALRTWFSEHEQTLNEATTRAHLIDRLIFDCLSWPRDFVNMEDAHDGEYSDYTLSTKRPAVIIEAKKEGTYFQAPIGHKRRMYKISTLLHGNSELKKAMEQVAGYCQKRGVPLAVVCNGHQLVAFVAVRLDGIPPMDGQALVFNSLETMEEEFLTLWQYLSLPGVEENTLLYSLRGERESNLPPKLSAIISNYPGTKSRNKVQADLQIVGDLILEDVTKNRNLEPLFLKECYSKSGALSHYALVSKQILEGRYAALLHSGADVPYTVPAVQKEGISPDLFSEGLVRRPILLLGDVGVGKTAFIRNLLLVEGEGLVDDSVFLYIDLGSNAALGQDLGPFIMSEIKSQLLNDHDVDIESNLFIRGVYNLDIERFRDSIYGPLREADPTAYQIKEIEHLENLVSNRQEHTRKSIEHIAKARMKQIIIVIDNADQRSDNIQQEAFLAAQELAENWQATVFVALRVETFYRSQRLGTLSGYHAKAFTIAPPQIDTVIEKRLNFALRLTSGNIPLDNYFISLKLKSLDSIIRVFLQSLRGNRDLVEFLDNISGGNVRLSLDLVRGFFGSGHMNTDKIINIFEQSGRYQIPLHEFYRAVAYGDHEHYDPNSSPIANLFDLISVDKKEHFIFPISLSILHSTSNTDSNSGFIESDRLYDQLQKIGFVPRQIDQAIRRFTRHKLIETDFANLEDERDHLPKTMRITTIGAYHIQKLITTFTYVDTVIVDTPILSKEYRTRIIDVQGIKGRIERVESFLCYLNECWEDLKGLPIHFNWGSTVHELKKDIEKIKNRIGERRIV